MHKPLGPKTPPPPPIQKVLWHKHTVHKRVHTRSGTDRCLICAQKETIQHATVECSMGLLILRRLRCLRRAIWVIILEERHHSGAYTHAFLCNVYPYTPPHFCYYFYLFGPLTPHKWCTCCPSPIWNGPCTNFASSLVSALRRWQG